MIVYVPGRMPSYTAYASAARLGAYQPGYLGQLLPSPPASPPHQQLQLLQPQPGPPIFAGWPRTMPQDEEMLAAAAGHHHHHHAQLAGAVVVNGPPSPAHSDSDASSSSLELGSVRRGEHAQLKCRWFNCGRWFTSLDELARHVAKHHAAPGPRGLFYCGWEGCQRGERGFNARYKMLVHVRTHTNEKPHGCTQCLKRFSRAENLKIHARSHTGERPYVCPVEGCNKAYSNSSDRFKHTRTHAVDKPYCCKVPGCSKRYTDPSSLRKHVKTYRHYVNNNDRRQEKSSCASEDVPMPMAPALAGQERATPEKRAAPASPARSESDKRDSSIESNTTSLSHCSISESPKAISSTSFEEQQRLVDWNNVYNLQERNKEHQQETHATVSSSSPSSLSLSLSSSKSSYEHEMQAGRYSRSSLYDEYILPDRQHHLPALRPQPASYPVDMKHCPPASPPDHLLAATPRMGMQSTPIKSEDKASGVDYRNIESIVNSSSSSGGSSGSCANTPLKREAYVAGDVVRNSVIKRADAHLHAEQSTAAAASGANCAAPATSAECCCRHNCCRHAENEGLLEKSKILSDLILKSQNPLFRHLLASVDLQYGLQSMWPGGGGGQPPTVPEAAAANTCAQDLRAKSAESLPVDMDQDLPLDLTINK